MESITVNHDIWTKVRGKIDERQYLKECLQEKVCPACGGDLANTPENSEYRYMCSIEGCDFAIGGKFVDAVLYRNNEKKPTEMLLPNSVKKRGK